MDLVWGGNPVPGVKEQEFFVTHVDNPHLILASSWNLSPGLPLLTSLYYLFLFRQILNLLVGDQVMGSPSENLVSPKYLMRQVLGGHYSRKVSPNWQKGVIQ